jgi:hypothetical protein
MHRRLLTPAKLKRVVPGSDEATVEKRLVGSDAMSRRFWGSTTLESIIRTAAYLHATSRHRLVLEVQAPSYSIACPYQRENSAKIELPRRAG